MVMMMPRWPCAAPLALDEASAPDCGWVCRLEKLPVCEACWKRLATAVSCCASIRIRRALRRRIELLRNLSGDLLNCDGMLLAQLLEPEKNCAGPERSAPSAMETLALCAGAIDESLRNRREERLARDGIHVHALISWTGIPAQPNGITFRAIVHDVENTIELLSRRRSCRSRQEAVYNENVSELRWHPLLREWVVVAAVRQDRPQMPKDWCPFDPGSGRVPDHYDVYLYPNDFPAFQLDSADPLIRIPARSRPQARAAPAMS